jgi:RimJ/RimL family protein N-acetyltransferase
VTGPARLFPLHLSTPRLELRLGSEDELEELGRLAARGIHPAEEMPFAVAWSDRAGEPGFLEEFVAYHLAALTDWDPDDWMLNLLVWTEGGLAGTQSIGVALSEPGRVVTTGSWLGASFQGVGIGTEMRAAVLELAFRGLEAEAATSAWLEGNIASARVSEKLGYRETHLSTKSPRGAPVVSHELRLERVAWHSPVVVAIDGLAECRDLLRLGGRSPKRT